MRPERARGFTLPELMAVLLLAGVLAAVAMPRLVDRGGFAARGTADTIAAALRYAQQAAIAMRRNVCVNVEATRLAVSVAAAAGATQPCAAALANPSTGAPFENAPYDDAGSTVAAPARVVFDALGRPLDGPGVALAAPLVITVNGHATVITIEPETGLVH